MSALVSVIIPYYNHKDSLPKLFNSIAAQSIISEVEIIIVDDCSDDPCEDVLTAYRNKGLKINSIRLVSRHYTKNARLAGIEKATGTILAFADADDMLWGTDVLEYHTRLLLRENADIVHFPTILLNADYKFLHEYKWAHPFADRLEGHDIFTQYVKATGHRSTLWSKIYSRSLALSVLDEARRSSVRRYREDVLLTSYFLFHAKRYIGSERVGYAHRRLDKDVIKAAGRAASSFYMLQELIPYLEKHGCSLDITTIFSKRLKKNVVKNIQLLCDTTYINEFPCVSDATVAGILEHADFETAMQMLSFVASTVQLAKLQRANYRLCKKFNK